MIIYCLNNKINNKIYIGKTVNLRNRLYQHKNCKKIYKINHAIRKYGWDAFEVAFSYEIDNCIASVVERAYIKYFDSINKGYNMTKGGEGTLGISIPCPDSKRKAVSLKLTGIKRSKEFCDGLSKRHKGKIISEKHKLQIKEKLTGTKQTEATKTKRIKSLMNYHYSHSKKWKLFFEECYDLINDFNLICKSLNCNWNAY